MAIAKIEKVLSVYVTLQDTKSDGLAALMGEPYFLHICPESVTKTPTVKGALPLSERALITIRQALERGALLGQYGYRGVCLHRDEHERMNTDFYHENLCTLSEKEKISYEAQEQFMRQGKELLTKFFGVAPIAYAPPNHLFDDDTLSIAQELGMEYIMDKNCTGLSHYQWGNVFVLPEKKLPDTQSNFVYTRLDGLLEQMTQIELFRLVSPETITMHPLDLNAIDNNFKEKMRLKHRRQN